MAVNHAGSKNTKSIFATFESLIKTSPVKHTKCAELLDILKSDEFSVGSSSAVGYSAKRLVRGLASKDLEKQTVFFSSLTTGIAEGILPVDVVLESLKKETQNAPLSKSDPTNIIMSVLTYGAIIRAGNLPQCTADVQETALKVLFDARKLKSYFENCVSTFIIELLKTMPKSMFNSILWPRLEEAIDLEKQKNIESDLLAVLLVAFTRFPKYTKDFIDRTFKTKENFYKKILILAQDYPLAVQLEIIKTIATKYANNNKIILKFWQDVTEKVDVNSKTSMYLLNFLKSILETVDDASLIPELIHPKVISTFQQYARLKTFLKKEASLKDLCEVVLKLIVARLSDTEIDKQIIFRTVNILLLDRGDIHFDSKTNSSTIQSLIALLSAENINELSGSLMKVVLGQHPSKEFWNSSERYAAIEMLGRSVRLNALRTEPAYIENILMFLFDISYSNLISLNPEVKRKGIEVLFKFVDLRGVKMARSVGILSTIINGINKNIANYSIATTATAIEDWKSVISADSKLVDGSDAKKMQAIRLFLLHMGLMLFKDTDMASASVKELLQCLQHIQTESRTDAEDEPHWVEVTVDLILSILAKENKTLRHIISIVFTNIVSEITPNSLQQIVDALDPTARNDVLKHVDSDDSDGSSSDSENDAENESDDEEMEDSDCEKETANDKLRMAVRNALGYSAALTDDESVDMDDMNEEEEEKLNESLANAFKLFNTGKGSKKKQTKDDEAVTHFRLRVLDLVEIIISSQPSFLTCLELMPPLITLLEFTIKNKHQMPLQIRLQCLLKKIGHIKKLSNVSKVSKDQIIESMVNLVDRPTHVLVYMELAPSILSCITLLMKAVTTVASEDGMEDVKKYWIKLMDRHFKENDRKVPNGMFVYLFNTAWIGVWDIAEHAMSLLLDKDLKLFKKQKLIALLLVFYRNNRLHSSATDDCKTAFRLVEKKFIKRLAKLLIIYNADMKANQIASSLYARLLELMYSVMTAHKKYRSDVENEPRWELVVEQFLLNTGLLQNKKTKKNLVRLAKMCNLEIPSVDIVVTNGADTEEDTSQKKVAGKKRKSSICEADSETGDDNSQKKTPDRKRKSSAETDGQTVEEPKGAKQTKKKKQNKNLKNEAKRLRASKSAEGLTDVHFKGIHLDALAQLKDEDE